MSSNISATCHSSPSKLTRQKSLTNNKANSNYILGIDVGTTSVKICLVDERTSESSDRFVKDTLAQSASDGCPMSDLQDPGKIYSALHGCVARMPKEKMRRVCRIAFCGQMHGIMFWKHGRGWLRSNDHTKAHVEMGDVSHLFTWQDGRCDEEFLQTLPKPDSHLRLASGYGCATVFWLQRKKADFLKQYDRCGTVMDYIVAMLCDNPQVVMSSHNAASWGYYSTEQNAWNMTILAENGFPIELLPAVVEAGQDAGFLADRWFDIPKGTPISAAMGDLQCSVRSTLINPDTDAVLNVSTSAQMAFVKSKTFQPAQGELKSGTQSSPVIEYLPYLERKYIAAASSLSGGNTLAAFVKMIQLWVVDLGLSIPQSKIWDTIIAVGCAACEPNENNDIENLNIVPTLYGERHAPNIRASISDINPNNMGLGQVTRGICHGIVRNLASMMPPEMLHEAGVTRIVGSGACLTRNPVLRAQVQEVYRLPVEYNTEGSACIGVALAVRDFHRSIGFISS